MRAYWHASLKDEYGTDCGMKFDSIASAFVWEFLYTVSGVFRRNKAAFAHHEFPRLGPSPRPARSSRACSRKRAGAVPAQAHIE